MKIAITGHRPDKLGGDYNLTSSLIKRIEEIIVDMLDKTAVSNNMLVKEFTLVTGMALGIDTLFAKIAISLQIPFIAAIPFKGQERMWPNKSQLYYLELLQQAQTIMICDRMMAVDFQMYQSLPQGTYVTQKMQKRNEWMVDNCDLLIAVWDLSSGGTKNCVMYAKSINKKIIHIDPKALILKS